MTNKRTLTPDEKKAKRDRSKKVGAQVYEKNIRAKYGPNGRPGLVTVKRLDDDEIVKIVDQRDLGAFPTKRETRNWRKRKRRARRSSSS